MTKKIVLFGLLMIGLLTLLLETSFADDPTLKTGGLNVFAKNGAYEIFVDDSPAGLTPVKIESLRSGSHYVKAVSNKVIVQDEIVAIRDGEITTVVVGVSEEVKKPEIQYVEVKKSEEPQGPDYSEKLMHGPYVTLGYLSSSFSSYDSYYYDDYSTYVDISGSSICYGVGYKYSFAPHLDAAVEISRADLSGNGYNWFVMPLSLNFTYSFGTAQKKDKWYMTLGLNDTLTNLSVGGTSLGGTGYSVLYGYEAPSWQDAAFYETGWMISKNSANVSSLMWVIRMGYRWNR